MEVSDWPKLVPNFSRANQKPYGIYRENWQFELPVPKSRTGPLRELAVLTTGPVPRTVQSLLCLQAIHKANQMEETFKYRKLHVLMMSIQSH